jgi:hypothetical protein
VRKSDPLEDWVDEGIERQGYYPSEFIAMRERYGTVAAMERLVKSGYIQSGFIRLKKLGTALEWSVEAGILKFPERFTREAREVAQFRIDNIGDPALR